MSAERLAFERLAIRRAPGFEEDGFELEDLSPAVNLIHGPQAVGKTTAGRAIEWLLWPEERRWRERSVAAEVRLGEGRWLIDADHAPPRLQREGHEASRLPTPGRELADRYSLALHDLLQVQTEEADLARLIDRELAGGFDLDAALRDVGARERPGQPRKLTAAYDEADARVRAVEAEQRELAAEERDLHRLRREEAEARRAEGELAQVEAVLEWRRCRDVLAREEQVLERRFPEAMGRMTGGEAERLAELGQRIEEAEERIEAHRLRIERAEADLGRADLPEGGVPGVVLSALAEERRRIELLEGTISERRAALEGARRRRDDARSRLGPGLDREAGDEVLRHLGPDDWKPLLDLAARSERLRARQAQALDVEAWIGRVERPAGAAALAAGAGRLRRWLASPAAPWRVGVPGLLASLLLTALALALALAVAAGGGPTGPLLPDPLDRVPPGLLWTAAGLGAVAAGWIGWGLLRGAGQRRAAATEYRRLGLEPPETWSAEAVEGRLRELEGRLAELAVETEKAARWAGLEERRERLEREAAELEAERGEVLARLGIAPELSAERDSAPLAALVRDLCAFRAADEEVREQESVLAARERERDEVLDSAERRLAEYGDPSPGRRGEGGSEEDREGSGEADRAGRVGLLAGRIEDLRSREEARAAARAVLDEAAGPDGALAREEKAVERLRDERDGLFEALDLEPGDRAGLTGLLDRLPEYREQVKRVEKAGYALERARAHLGEERPDEDREVEEPRGLRDLPEEELESRRADLERRAGRLEELVRRIGVIEDRVARAKESHNLEEALAARDEALAALREERERDADALVAHEVGGWLREQMRGRRRPVVMKRAAELFARITAGRFELLDPSGDPPELRARDTASGRGRSLGELSGGIRLQLLLAVRMAFIEDQEGSVRLPLVMDETLANSDDRTARAIIDAVLELAREGRQVFYLTAQADEVAKWRAALEESGDGPAFKEIDLAAVRRLQEAEERPRSTRSPSGWHPGEAREPVPAPGALSREEYADLLGVPALDPHRDVGAVHLWYLVEDPAVLHRLLEAGYRRWGQLASLDPEAAAAALGGGEEGEARRRRIAARAACLEALVEGWRVGRGRPVGRAELLESGAVSDRFIDEVTELSREVEGDARALIDSLRAQEVPHFRAEKTDDLEEFFEERGHLDRREPLDRGALRARALQVPRTDLGRGPVTPAEVEALLAALPGVETF